MIPGGVGGVATADGVVLAIGVGEGCTGEAGWEGSVAGFDPVAGGVEPVCEDGAGGAGAAAGAVGMVGAGGGAIAGACELLLGEWMGPAECGPNMPVNWLWMLSRRGWDGRGSMVGVRLLALKWSSICLWKIPLPGLAFSLRHAA